MKQLTLQDQYNLIQEGKGNKEIFLKAAKKSYPNLISNSAGFDEAAAILKKRSVISENLLGIGLISQNNTQPDWFSIFNNRMKNLQEEAKIEERKPTKEVVDLETQGYNYKDKSNSNNNPGFFQGFYTEMKDPKNCEKSVEEITEMVSKNLAKDPLFYVKDGQFGVKGIGYTDDVPGLRISKELQGKYKSSGYGDIKESLTEAKKKNGIQAYIKEIEKRGSMAALEAKISALDEAIEERKQKLSSIEENEDIAEFINQSSLKEIQREIKELEKAKESYAKIREKMISKNKKPQRGVIKENPLEGNTSLEQIAEKVREILREYHEEIDEPFDDNFVRIEGDKIYFRVGFWEVLPQDLKVKIISGLSELNIGENSIKFSKEDMYADDEQVDQYEIVLSVNNNIGENLSFRNKGKSDTVSEDDWKKDKDGWEILDDDRAKVENIRDYSDKEYQEETGEYFENDITMKVAPKAFKDRNDMIQKIKAAKPIFLSSEEMQNMSNTDVGDILSASEDGGKEAMLKLGKERAKEYGKDWNRLEKGITSNSEVPAPLALRDKNGNLHLLAGNTRMMSFTASGKKLPVKVIDYDGDFQYEIVLSVNNNIGENLSFRNKGKSDTVSEDDVFEVAQKAGEITLDAQSALEDLITVFGPNIPRYEFINVLEEYDMIYLANDVLYTQPSGFSMNETKLRKVIRNIIRETLSK